MTEPDLPGIGANGRAINNDACPECRCLKANHRGLGCAGFSGFCGCKRSYDEAPPQEDAVVFPDVAKPPYETPVTGLFSVAIDATIPPGQWRLQRLRNVPEPTDRQQAKFASKVNEHISRLLERTAAAEKKCAAILALCNADYALGEPAWSVPTDAIRAILEPQFASLNASRLAHKTDTLSK